MEKRTKIIIAVGTGLVLTLFLTRKSWAKGFQKKETIGGGETDETSSSSSTSAGNGGNDSFPLKRGSYGSNVALLQQKLNTRYNNADVIMKAKMIAALTTEAPKVMMPMVIDKDFGARTEKTVKILLGKRDGEVNKVEFDSL